MKIETKEIKGAKFVEFTNDAGFKMVVTPHGASLRSLVYDGVEMMKAQDNVDDFLTPYGFHGRALGRVAGRIPSTFEFGGKKYALEPNEGNLILHGGKNNVSEREWDLEIIESQTEAKAVFTIHLDEEDDGLPGSIDIKISYIIPAKGTYLRVEMENDDHHGFSNVGIHPYFSLGSDSMKGAILTIDSKRVMDYGPGMMPLKVIEAPANLDFSKGKELGVALSDPELRKSCTGGLDHYFELQHKEKDVLVIEKKPIKMTIRTSYPGIQIYGNNYPAGFKLQGGQGFDSLFGALAIEPMGDILTVLKQPDLENSHHFGYIEYRFSKI